MATPPEEPANDVEEAVQDEAEEDDEVVKCVCGRTDSFGLMIQCEDCGIWQHGECVNIPNKALSPKHYYCEACRPNMHPYNKHLLSGNWRTARKPPRDLVNLGSSNLKTDRAAPSKRKTMNSMEASQSFTEIFQLSTKEGGTPAPSGDGESDGGSGSAKVKKRKRAGSKRTGDGSSPEDEDSSQADEYRQPAGGPRGIKRGRFNNSGRSGRSDNEDASDNSETEAPKPKKAAGGGLNGDTRSVVEQPEATNDEESEMEIVPPVQPREKPAGRGRGGHRGRGGMAKKLAALNAARQQEQMWRHIVDHNHPPGAPVNFAELPAVKPKIPNNKASLGEMCKRVRILREWAHRMQLNHIPLMGLEVASEQLPPTDASPSAEGSSRDLMTKFLAGLTAFQEKYGTYANTGRMRAHPAGPGEGNPSENPSSEPLPGLDGGSDVPGGVGIAAGITDEDHA